MTVQLLLRRSSPTPVIPITVAAATDELTLLVSSDGLTSYDLEVYRGAVRRQRQSVKPTDGLQAFRLIHGQGGTSPRLVCRVLVAGRVEAETSVIVTASHDNQGRISADNRPIGEGTRIAYDAAFQELLRPKQVELIIPAISEND